MKNTIKIFGTVAIFATLLFASCKKEDNSPKPVADFSISSRYSTRVDTFFYGDSVLFNNLSTDADTYLWSFSDGTTSTEKNPKKYYVNPRTTEFINLPVTLTATKGGKSSTKTKTIVGWWD
jgi:PKD repeat protein